MTIRTHQALRNCSNDVGPAAARQSRNAPADCGVRGYRQGKCRQPWPRLKLCTLPGKCAWGNATFVFDKSLTQQPKLQGQLMIAQPEGAPAGRASCILVVEDEVLIRTFIAEVLRDEGFRVVEAVNADEAWAFLEAGGHADLVFTDIDMPGSIDGAVLGERIKARYPTYRSFSPRAGSKAQ
jgi:hypothetical protein